MQTPNLRLIDVVRAADEFLKTYHPSSSLPVPIEQIVEHKMNISVYAVPNIKFLLGIDAFISSDFTQITIDDNSFTKYPERTRFSIAHEIGHLVLHKKWYETYGPKNLEDYVTLHEKINNQSYKYIEIQAQTFAGLVLVPKDSLFHELKKRLGRIPTMEAPEVLSPVAQDLLEVFRVSGEVMLRRLQKERIVKLQE